MVTSPPHRAILLRLAARCTPSTNGGAGLYTEARSDGAVVTYATSPYPAMLEGFCAKGEWEPALRLCRYVKQELLWACLAAMAVAGKELHTAEVAYAAISQVDKLLYMCHIKELPTREAREAELLLFLQSANED